MGAVIQEHEQRKRQTLQLKTKSLASYHHHANLQIPKSSSLVCLSDKCVQLSLTAG